MKLLKIISFLFSILMGTSILYGFIFGNFTQEGNVILSIPWGVISLIDIYIMFTLFWFWIVFRERSFTKSILWLILIYAFGSFSASLYVFITILKSKGNWKKFWLNKN